MIVVNTPRHDCQSQQTFDAIKDYLARDDGQTTALLCLIDEMALPALAACRAMNRAVPERMSLIASGDSPTMAFAHPPVTCIDIHIAQHLNTALAMLDRALDGSRGSNHLLHLIEPHLMLRESVGAVLGAQASSLHPSA